MITGKAAVAGYKFPRNYSTGQKTHLDNIACFVYLNAVCSAVFLYMMGSGF